MPSKMTSEQLAAVKAATANANTLNALATAANGHGVNSQQKRRAQEELDRAVGKKKAARLQEGALQRAGARPKGLRRFFG